MKKEDMMLLAANAAKKAEIDVALVQAVCHHESDWNRWATRFEPAFYNRYVCREKMPTVQCFGGIVSEATERQFRATSFGLMQIMGQTAREFGFKGEYLSELCDPVVGLELACAKLAKCLSRARGDVRDALQAYNGGGNPDYSDMVMTHYGTYAT